MKITSEQCFWRDKFPSLVKSIFAYPTPTDHVRWTGDILSDEGRTFHGKNLTSFPWEVFDTKSRELGSGPYDVHLAMTQFNTELLVRDLLMHPKSQCLLTKNATEAKLFYIPYLPSAEYHKGEPGVPQDYSTSPYGQAIRDILERNSYDEWHKVWGLTSRWWKRRSGSDHILVFSEPLHGLWHPRGARGNFHYLRSQYQTHSPIIVSVELSTTFVQMYPQCANKNILLPYPNTDGSLYNGKKWKSMEKDLIAHVTMDGIMKKKNPRESNEADRNELPILHSPAALQTERELMHAEVIFPNNTIIPRVLAQYLKAGNHGSCAELRRATGHDFSCSASGKLLRSYNNVRLAMRNNIMMYKQSTFCPSPGGDSPSAKRMFDAIFAGCIPVILSHDFVWPFSTDTRQRNIPKDSWLLDPAEFSIRLNATNYKSARFDSKCNKPFLQSQPSLLQNITMNTGIPDHIDIQDVLESITVENLKDLKNGVERVAKMHYNWYRFDDPSLPDNPLKEGVLPSGGVSFHLLRSLAERGEGKLWHLCRIEMEKIKEDTQAGKREIDNVNAFKC
jgi:hypothetical protein